MFAVGTRVVRTVLLIHRKFLFVILTVVLLRLFRLPVLQVSVGRLGL